MGKYLYLLPLIAIFVFAFFWGCNPVEPIPEPVTAIYIRPDYTEIALGESIELKCIDQLGRSVLAQWSKRCGAGNLSVEMGETCIYTAPRTEGIQMIYADYENLRAVARVRGINK